MANKNLELNKIKEVKKINLAEISGRKIVEYQNKIVEVKSCFNCENKPVRYFRTKFESNFPKSLLVRDCEIKIIGICENQNCLNDFLRKESEGSCGCKIKYGMSFASKTTGNQEWVRYWIWDEIERLSTDELERFEEEYRKEVIKEMNFYDFVRATEHETSSFARTARKIVRANISFDNKELIESNFRKNTKKEYFDKLYPLFLQKIEEFKIAKNID